MYVLLSIISGILEWMSIISGIFECIIMSIISE